MRASFRASSTIALLGLLTLSACGGSRNSALSSETSAATNKGASTSASTSTSTGSSSGSTNAGGAGGTSDVVYLVYYTVTGMTSGQTLTVNLSYAGGTQTENITFDPKVSEYFFGDNAPNNFWGLPQGTAYTLALSNEPTGLTCAVSPASGLVNEGSPATISCTAGSPTASSVARPSVLAAQTRAITMPGLLRPAVATDATGLTYLFGGMSADASGLQTDRSDLWIRSASGVWAKAAVPYGDVPAARHAATAWVGADGRLFIFGGASAGAVLSDFWAFDPGTGSWSAVPAKGASPAGRTGAAGWVAANGNLFLYGSDSNSAESNELWAFDVGIGAWRELSGHAIAAP